MIKLEIFGKRWELFKFSLSKNGKLLKSLQEIEKNSKIGFKNNSKKFLSNCKDYPKILKKNKSRDALLKITEIIQSAEEINRYCIFFDRSPEIENFKKKWEIMCETSSGAVTDLEIKRFFDKNPFETSGTDAKKWDTAGRKLSYLIRKTIPGLIIHKNNFKGTKNNNEQIQNISKKISNSRKIFNTIETENEKSLKIFENVCKFILEPEIENNSIVGKISEINEKILCFRTFEKEFFQDIAKAERHIIKLGYLREEKILSENAGRILEETGKIKSLVVSFVKSGNESEQIFSEDKKVNIFERINHWSSLFAKSQKRTSETKQDQLVAIHAKLELIQYAFDQPPIKKSLEEVKSFIEDKKKDILKTVHVNIREFGNVIRSDAKYFSGFFEIVLLNNFEEKIVEQAKNMTSIALSLDKIAKTLETKNFNKKKMLSDIEDLDKKNLSISFPPYSIVLNSIVRSFTSSFSLLLE